VLCCVVLCCVVLCCVVLRCVVLCCVVLCCVVLCCVVLCCVVLNTHTHTHTHTCTHAHTHTHTHTDTHTHTLMHTLTHIHTHTRVTQSAECIVRSVCAAPTSAIMHAVLCAERQVMASLRLPLFMAYTHTRMALQHHTCGLRTCTMALDHAVSVSLHGLH
jgi:hypothetical protein